MDKYLYFTFNNINSSKYNLFIINNNNLKIFNNTNSSSKFSSPMNQNKSYLLGFQSTQRTISFECASTLNTYEEYQDMMLWLRAGTVGSFNFDYINNWYYNVILDNVSDSDLTHTSDKIITTFTLTFKTIGSWCTIGMYNAGYIASKIKSFPTTEYRIENNMGIKTDLEKSVANTYGIPEICFYKQDNNKKYFKIQHIGNDHLSFKYNFCTDFIQKRLNTDTVLSVVVENKEYYRYYFDSTKLLSNLYDIEINSEYGFILCNNKLIEQEDILSSIGFNEGPIKIETNAPTKININNISIISNTDTNKIIKITIPLIEYYNCMSKYNKFFFNISRQDSTSSINFNEESTIGGQFPIKFFDWIFYDEDLLDTKINDSFIDLTFKGNFNRDLITINNNTVCYCGQYSDMNLTDLGSVDSHLEIIKYNNM